jgi:hypothetical protein
MKKQLALICLLISFAVASNASETWQGLVVEPENRCTPYDKKTQYPYPQSVEDIVVAEMGGRIYGPYSGRHFASDRDTDIEHIVAASEGHDSGLCAASKENRKKFATDPLNLTLASPEVNRCGVGGKCGFDAGEWLPEKNQCWFANRVIEIKTKYGLSVDRNEATALSSVLKNCTSVEMVFHSRSTAEPLTQSLGKHKSSTALDRYDDNSNGRITCAEARFHGISPVMASHEAYKYMHDGDGDGVVCE